MLKEYYAALADLTDLITFSDFNRIRVCNNINTLENGLKKLGMLREIIEEELKLTQNHQVVKVLSNILEKWDSC